jgi:hypothetical protein
LAGKEGGLMADGYDDMTLAEQEAVLREAHETTDLLLEQRPKRASEAPCWDLLAKRGWYVQKRGWPDFLCSGQTADFREIVFCVEVKRHPDDLPRPDQLAMMRTLELARIACFIWDRHLGFRRVGSYRADDGDEMGKLPGDVECPDPSLLRCVWCQGGGKEWADIRATDEQERFRTCSKCSGTGLAAPRLEPVE